MIPTELATGQTFRSDEAEGLRRLLKEALDIIEQATGYDWRPVRVEDGTLKAERERVWAQQWLKAVRG